MNNNFYFNIEKIKKEKAATLYKYSDSKLLMVVDLSYINKSEMVRKLALRFLIIFPEMFESPLREKIFFLLEDIGESVVHEKFRVMYISHIGRFDIISNLSILRFDDIVSDDSDVICNYTLIERDEFVVKRIEDKNDIKFKNINGYLRKEIHNKMYK